MSAEHSQVSLAYSVETNSRPDPLSSFFSHANPRLPFGDDASSLPWEDSSGGFMFVGFHETENGRRELLSQTPPPSFPSFLIGINT